MSEARGTADLLRPRLSIARYPLGRTWTLLCVLTSGASFALAYPPFGWWPLCFVALLPLLLACWGRGAWARAAWGAATGVVAAWLAAAPAVSSAASRFLDAPLGVGLAVTVPVVSAVGAAGFGSFALLAGDVFRGSAGVAVLRVAAACIGAELVRMQLLGFPWLLLSHALAPEPELLQLASWIGIAGLSGWIAALGVSGLRAFTGPDRGVAASVCIGLSICAWLAVADAPQRGADPEPGSIRTVVAGSAPPAGALRVALVQPGATAPTSVLQTREHLAQLVSLSLSAGDTPYELIVWPESSLQSHMPANEALLAPAFARLAPQASGVLAGVPFAVPEEAGRRTNAAVLYDFRDADHPGDFVSSRHEKVELVPGFESTLPWMSRIGVAGAGLSPGAAPSVLQLGATTIGPIICFEVLFPELARQLTQEGAEVLIQLSNDSYFAGTAGAEQHLQAAVLLAVATRRPLLRSTSTGVTAAIDANGRVVGRLPADEPGVLLVDVVPVRERSPADRAGAWPERLSLALALGFLLLDRLPRRR